jgi:hypothetical protein
MAAATARDGRQYVFASPFSSWIGVSVRARVRVKAIYSNSIKIGSNKNKY